MNKGRVASATLSSFMLTGRDTANRSRIDMNTTLLLAVLLQHSSIAPAPTRTDRHGDHSEALVEVGTDHTGKVTLDDEALEQLDDVLDGQLTGCSFGQAMDAAEQGRRICRQDAEAHYLAYDGKAMKRVGIYEDNEHCGAYRASSDDRAANDWVILERVW